MMHLRGPGRSGAPRPLVPRTNVNGARFVKKRRLRKTQLIQLALRVAKFLLKSQLLTLLFALCALGFVVGKQVHPDPKAIPFEELFENLSVVSYRETPSDSAARFVVELSTRGRVFRQYDIDEQRFEAPVRGHDYRRAISITRYLPLKVRGHVDRGFWLELPDSSTHALLPGQFDELYQTTLDFVKPVSAAAVVLGTLSGYSMGYRIGTWSSSLSNPKVQERVLAVPGIGRVIAREAWRRVLLEPVVMAQESDAARFASVRGTQRIYTNFFRLALGDSNGFVTHEAARLDSAGCTRESRAMRSFAQAVQCAAQDTCDLSSADFAAGENWANLLDRRGHWAYRSTPPRGEERMRYLGTRAWYGVAPTEPDEQRIWVGRRFLVRYGDTEGFVADEIPLTRIGCPIAWRDWLRGDSQYLGTNAWTAQFMRESRQFAPVVQLGRGIADKLRGGKD